MTFTTEHHGRFGVEPILRALHVAPSTYYGWLHQRAHPCARRVLDAAITERMEAIHEMSGQTYGSPRIHAQLRRDGVRVGRKRVERLMRAHGMEGVQFRRSKLRTTRQDPAATPAPDLVNRDFTATRPNQLWLADFTYVPTGEGTLYLAAIRDAFSRRIVGWTCSDRMTTDLVLGALELALWQRDVIRGELVHHSDRGSQYTSLRFSQRLIDAGIAASMGSTGDSFDNAMAETFFSIIKREKLYRHTWRTRHDAEMAIFEFIDGWYNPRRIQKELGWLSPEEFEEAHYEIRREALTSVGSK